MSPINPALFFVSFALLNACGGRSSETTRFARWSGGTCVVLSVGGFKGVAHSGALRSLREHHLTVDCVVGNSMGALVAALYATDPDEDPSARVKPYFAAYVKNTEEQVASNAGFGALVLRPGEYAHLDVDIPTL